MGAGRGRGAGGGEGGQRGERWFRRWLAPGRGRLEVGDDPDRWAPPVGLHERGERVAAAWAGVGRARRRERKERVGPDSAQGPRRGGF